MFFHLVTGTSELGPEQAVGAAVSSTVNFSREAKSMHIVLLGIAKIGTVWRAVVRVVVEPGIAAEDDTAEQARKRHKKHEEEERELQKQEEDELQHLAVHFHALEDMDVMFNEIEFPFEDYSLHLMKDGALWENVQKQYPDIDFYEAVHKQSGPDHHPAELRHTLEQEQTMLAQLKKRRASLALEEEF